MPGIEISLPTGTSGSVRQFLGPPSAVEPLINALPAGTAWFWVKFTEDGVFDDFVDSSDGL